MYTRQFTDKAHCDIPGDYCGEMINECREDAPPCDAAPPCEKGLLDRVLEISRLDRWISADTLILIGAVLLMSTDISDDDILLIMVLLLLIVR